MLLRLEEGGFKRPVRVRFRVRGACDFRVYGVYWGFCPPIPWPVATVVRHSAMTRVSAGWYCLGVASSAKMWLKMVSSRVASSCVPVSRPPTGLPWPLLCATRRIVVRGQPQVVPRLTGPNHAIRVQGSQSYRLWRKYLYRDYF